MSDSNRIKVGVVTDFPVGQAVVKTVDGLSIVVCNFEGKFYALENICSHDDAELVEPTEEGPACAELDGCQIVCPRHQAKFDIRDGTVTEPPAVFPIAAYDVTVRGKSVYVEIDD